MLTGLLVPKLTVGEPTALGKLEVTEAVNHILPMNPPLGVAVIVEVFPVVAPGDRVTAVPPSAKPPAANALTVTLIVVEAVRLPEVPLMVAVYVPGAVALAAVRVTTLVLVVGLVAKAA
jgi:hypothetical protein